MCVVCVEWCAVCIVCSVMCGVYVYDVCGVCVCVWCV